jgi:ubiquinone/menaquinone biosynthesis C-methylase UbiE
VESAVHAQGADLETLETIVRERAPAHALDLGAGGGHVAYRMARHARVMTAYDLSSEMLAAVAATASERGLDNVLTQQGAAEQLPFEAGTFDFLATRYSAHHWRSFEAGLREARRVLKPGSCTVFVDSYAPGQPLFDTHLQAIELLRDTSHCRDYSAAEWLAGLGRAGFALIGGIVPPMGRIKRARSDLARRRPTRA